MALSDDFLYQLKSSNPIESVMASYIALTRRGHNYVCSCPFHSEKTPSCTIYPDTQSFFCFGCGAGGDVITFIKRIENLEYIEAVKLLAERSGIEIPDDRQNAENSNIKARTLEINRAAANFFYKNLISGNDKRGLTYFAERKLTPQTIKKYGLGYSPDSWQALADYMKLQGFTNDELVAAGVCKYGKNGGIYDVFHGRVMFPIVDLRGNVIAFGGRILDDSKPKYLNSSDTVVFKKSRNLFSLNFAKNSSSKTLILAEGYMDVIAVNQAGFENVVATLGTAVTPEQARLMSQYANEVIIAYDSDSAGQKAVQKAINLLSEVGINTRIIKMESAKDPDEYIKKFGATRFKMLLDNSDGAINFELEKCKNGLDLDSESGKIDCLKRSVIVLSQISNRLERNVYISKIAKEFEISPEVLIAQVDDTIRKKHNVEKKKEWKAITSHSKSYDNVNPDARKYPKQCKAEEWILAYIFRSPDIVDSIRQTVTPDLFVTEFNRRVYQVLCGKLNEHTTFSISIFAEDFNDEEMGRITGIEAKNKDIILNESTLNDSVKILTDFKYNTVSDASEDLSDEDLLLLAQRLRNTK